MTHRTLQLLASGALLLSSACMSAAEAEIAQAEQTQPELEGTQIALRAGASVGPDEIDGYCENGLGVYLSADDHQAMLTVYVVTPAKSAIFINPTLHLTTQHDNKQWTQDRQFETIELQAGQSRTFAQEADGPLMDVEAEVSTL